MIAFLFAGQGSQYVSMGKDFYDTNEKSKQIYDAISMDFDVKKVCFEGPLETLNNTAYTQSCILATSLAIASAVADLGIKPDYVAGLSLGEYSALTFAGALSMEEALPLVRIRGNLMADALRDKGTCMMAVMRPNIEEIKQIVSEIDDLYVANYNSPKQIVLSGSQEACEVAKQRLEELKMRCVPLQVSGAFHSPYLDDASFTFRSSLKNVNWQQQQIPVVFNVSGDEQCDDIVNVLANQMRQSVLFEQSIRYMIAQGVDTFIEIGPGKVLSKLVKQINPDVKVYAIDKVEDLEALHE